MSVLAAIHQDVDGGPAPAMTRWASIARYVKQLSGGGP
jgi:hypothetical protein